MKWLLAAIFFQSASVACAKQAALGSVGLGLMDVLLSPFYVLSLVMLGCQAVCWIVVVKRYPLSIAYPITSLSLVLNLIVAYLLFNEALGVNHLLGMGLIFGGIVLLYREPATAPQ